jgi:hypothetical protein
MWCVRSLRTQQRALSQCQIILVVLLRQRVENSFGLNELSVDSSLVSINSLVGTYSGVGST